MTKNACSKGSGIAWSCQQEGKAVFDYLQHGQGMKYGAGNINGPSSQPAAGVLGAHQILREHGVEVLEREGIEAYLVGVLDQHLDSRLVVEDHLRLNGILAWSDLTVFDQVLSIQAGICVAFQSG